MTLKNKNIFITGAGKGIGERTVKDMINAGAYVYTLIKDKKDNIKFKNQNNLKIYNGNVLNLKLINRIISDSRKNKRPINGIVNNAGVRLRKEFIKINSKDLRKVLDVNFFSMFYILQNFSKFWIKNRIQGTVVNLSSIVGKTGFKELSAHAASKGAVTSLTKSFATEMARYGIRANCISPGFTKTSFYTKFKKNKKLYNWTLSRIPSRRWGEPKEVSNLICFLLSNNSNYINGEDISIDGGWLSS